MTPRQAASSFPGEGASFAAKAEDGRSPELIHLPTDILEHILSTNPIPTVCHARASCKVLFGIASQPYLWGRLAAERWRQLHPGCKRSDSASPQLHPCNVPAASIVDAAARLVRMPVAMCPAHGVQIHACADGLLRLAFDDQSLGMLGQELAHLRLLSLPAPPPTFRPPAHHPPSSPLVPSPQARYSHADCGFPPIRTGSVGDAAADEAVHVPYTTDGAGLGLAGGWALRLSAYFEVTPIGELPSRLGTR